MACAHSHPLQGDSFQITAFLLVTSRPHQGQQCTLNLSAQRALGHLLSLQLGAKSSSHSSSWSPWQGRMGHRQGLIHCSPSFGVRWCLQPLLAGLQMLCSGAMQGNPSFAWKAELEGIFFPLIWPGGESNKTAFHHLHHPRSGEESTERAAGRMTDSSVRSC